MVLNRFTAYFRDNQMYVQFSDTKVRLYSFTRSNFIKYKFEILSIDGKPIIMRTSKLTKDKIPVGSEIFEFNHMPVKEYLNKEVISTLLASSKRRFQVMGIRNLLSGIYGTTFFVKIKKTNGDIVSFELTCCNSSDEWYPAKPNSLFYKSINNGEIAYLQISLFLDAAIVDSLKKYLPNLKKAKGLIINICNNMGGSSVIANNIAKYFGLDSIITRFHVKTRINICTLNLETSNLTPIDSIGNKYLSNIFLCYNKLLLTNAGISKFKNNISNIDKIIVPTFILIDSDNITVEEEFLRFTKETDT